MTHTSHSEVKKKKKKKFFKKKKKKKSFYQTKKVKKSDILMKISFSKTNLCKWLTLEAVDG